MSEQTGQQPLAGDGAVDGPTGISSAAEALVAAQENGTPTSQTPGPKDVSMTDAPLEQSMIPPTQAPTTTSQGVPPSTTTPTPMATAIAPQPTPPLPSAASPIPARTGTPMRNGEGPGGNTGSRAASAHPDQGPAMPSEAAVHGAPVRQYINGKITGVLLEGMKLVAKEQPKDPLRVLGEFFLQRSKEIEGAGPQ